MSKFEKRFGKYAVKNISLYLILAYGLGYLITQVNPVFMDYLSLNPDQIIRGQIWRIFTWVIRPPQEGNIFLVAIMLLFYYNIGTALERTWGTYKYNLYLFLGMVLTVAGSFLALGCSYLFDPELFVRERDFTATYFTQLSTVFSTYYINMSIFLAYAATYPEARVLLMFIVPVKVKWLGILYGGMLVLELFSLPVEEVMIFFTLPASAAIGVWIFMSMPIIVSLLNFLLFWLRSRNHIHRTPKDILRKQHFKQEIKKNPKITRHKCAICGRSEEDDPTLEFRFCSKCNGNYEYCQEHLFTHVHKN